jgi:hypothetical protein
VVNVVETPLGKQALDLRQVLGSHGREDTVLVGGEPKVALVDLGNLAKSRLELVSTVVLDTTVLDEHVEVPLAVATLDPAVRVEVGLEGVRSLRLEGLAHSLLDFGAEVVDAHAVDCVLETLRTISEIHLKYGLTHSVLPVLAVTVVPLCQHDLLRHEATILRLDKAESGTETGVRLLVGVSDTHTTANRHVVTDDLVVLHDSDEADVVGEHVDGIVRGNRHGNLELSREVVRAVERLKVLDCIATDLLLVEPDLVVGRGRWEQVLRDCLGKVEDGLVDVREVGVDRALNVTVWRDQLGFASEQTGLLTDVTASGDGVKQALVDRLHGRLEVLLDDAVELEGLPGRELEGAVTVLVGDAVHVKPLLGGAYTSGHADTDHERVGGLKTLSRE